MNLNESLITNNSIQLNAKATDWQSAIKIGTDALVKAGVTEERYYDAIIKLSLLKGHTSVFTMHLLYHIAAQKMV